MKVERLLVMKDLSEIKKSKDRCKMKDLTIILKDSPGTLADLCEILAIANINIEGISVITYKGECPIHILVENGNEAVKTLEAHWMEVIEVRDAFIVQFQDQPGFLAAVARKIADHDINIETTYLTTKGDLAFVVDDMEKADLLFKK
jgi:hypothetical protein